MSQQINLLVKKRHGPDLAMLALVLLALVLIVMVGRWAIGLKDVNAARQAAQLSAQQVQETRAKLQATAATSADSNVDMEMLKQKAQAAQQLLAKAGELGSREGYSRYFSTLADIAEPDLWLTDVSIPQGGQNPTISGKALRKEAVLRYAQRLNAAFAGYGVQFKVLEMTPESSPAANGAPALETMAFKLY